MHVIADGASSGHGRILREVPARALDRPPRGYMAVFDSAWPLALYTSTSYPTVGLSVTTKSGYVGRVALPLGYEDTGYHGSSRDAADTIFKALDGLVGPLFAGRAATDQRQMDEEIKAATQSIDDPMRRSQVRYLLSAGCAKAIAVDCGMHLYGFLAEVAGLPPYTEPPVPMIALISGGRVSSTPFRVQAVMVVPAGLKSLDDRIRAGSEVSAVFSGLLRSLERPYAVGDEGGFSVAFDRTSSREMLFSTLDLVVHAIDTAGYKAGDIKVAIDFAAKYSRLPTGEYALVVEDEALTVDDVLDLCSLTASRYPIMLLEDPLGVEDLSRLPALRRRLGSAVTLAADDLQGDDYNVAGVTNPDWSCEAVIVMPDRIGTLSDTIDFVRRIRAARLVPVASHRSSETEDVLLSDLTAALSLPFVKAGGMNRSDRTAKYNQLMRIDEISRARDPNRHRVVSKGAA